MRGEGVENRATDTRNRAGCHVDLSGCHGDISGCHGDLSYHRKEMDDICTTSVGNDDMEEQGIHLGYNINLGYYMYHKRLCKGFQHYPTTYALSIL